MLLDPAFALEVRNPGFPVGPADGAEHQVRHACGLGCIGDVHAVLRLRLHPGGGGSHRENAGDAGERGAQARRVLDVRSGQCRALRCESASRRRTGVAHTTPISYLPDGDRFVVTGSGGGSPSEPQWFRNLRAASVAQIELGARTLTVSVSIAEGPERDALWQTLVAQTTNFAKYQAKVERQIPMAVLTPRT